MGFLTTELQAIHRIPHCYVSADNAPSQAVMRGLGYYSDGEVSWLLSEYTDDRSSEPHS
jgi:hypothetical protein